MRWSDFPFGSTIRPRPLHPPILLEEIRRRIDATFADKLAPLGFVKVSRRFEVWVRRRTAEIYDVAGPNFVKSDAALGMVQVSISASLHLPLVESIYHRLAGGVYRVQDGTASLRPDVIPRKARQSRFFWSVAYSHDDAVMIADYVICQLSKLECVVDYSSLLSENIFLLAEKKAIVLALMDRQDEAESLLLSSMEEQELRFRGRTAVLMDFPDWRAKVGLLQALNDGKWARLVEEAAEDVRLRGERY